jgi:nickel-dependent lactate racemase
MFGDLDAGLFLAHDHRRGVKRLGTIEPAFVQSVSGGRLSFEYPGDYAEALVSGGWDLIISLGQVVPHEVVGMANYTKNLAVGLGGASSIDYSHWLGAVSNLEAIMGEPESPVRAVLDESARRFLKGLPIVYVHTVVSRKAEGQLALRGLFAGPGPDQDRSCFLEAAALARKVNIEVLPEAPLTCVVNLDPLEFRSTWLGNKAVYRTRMALADGADLFILAPGVERFGEDPAVDALIRRHGYRGTTATLAAVDSDPELRANLSAAAHLVHGSSEGRFRITYCTARLSRAEVEGVGYAWMGLDEALERFRPQGLSEGWNGKGPKRLFYVSNPALGLWKRALR